MQEKAPNVESVLAPLELAPEALERAALVVKRHAKDESDLSSLLDALGLAV